MRTTAGANAHYANDRPPEEPVKKSNAGSLRVRGRHLLCKPAPLVAAPACSAGVAAELLGRTYAEALIARLEMIGTGLLTKQNPAAISNLGPTPAHESHCPRPATSHPLAHQGDRAPFLRKWLAGRIAQAEPDLVAECEGLRARQASDTSETNEACRRLVEL